MTVGFIFSETKNRRNKRDGDEFKRCASELQELWEGDQNLSRSKLILAGAENKTAKRELVYSTLRRTSDLQRIAFLCHGWPSGISMGFDSKHVAQLARAIASSCCSNVVYIGLFACLTGMGKFWGGKRNKKNLNDRAEKIVTPREGFAMYLCSELDKLGIHAVITAHLTSGHTTRNPYKVRIEERNGLINRQRMCPSSPSVDWRDWVKRLNSDQPFALETMLNRKHG